MLEFELFKKQQTSSVQTCCKNGLFWFAFLNAFSMNIFQSKLLLKTCCNMKWWVLNYHVFLLILVWNHLDILDHPSPSRKPILNIAILSARENFAKRQAIRETWLALTEAKSSLEIDAKFVLGTHSCTVHPDNRLNAYSCERKNYSLLQRNGLGTENCVFVQVPPTMSDFFNGFSFSVQFDIVVTKLIVPNNLTNVYVEILDAFTKVNLILLAKHWF